MKHKQIANYVLSLKEAIKTTQRAEDRSVYGMYLADAGVLLAMVVSEASKDDLAKAVMAHERLKGNSWPSDPAHKIPDDLWREILRKCGDCASG